MNLFEEAMREANKNSDFDGLYDEAYTNLINDIKNAVRTGCKQYYWRTGKYVSMAGTVDDKRLVSWLIKDGFKKIYYSKMRSVWIVVLEDDDSTEE